MTKVLLFGLKWSNREKSNIAITLSEQNNNLDAPLSFSPTVKCFNFSDFYLGNLCVCLARLSTLSTWNQVTHIYCPTAKMILVPPNCEMILMLSNCLFFKNCYSAIFYFYLCILFVKLLI